MSASESPSSAADLRTASDRPTAEAPERPRVHPAAARLIRRPTPPSAPAHPDHVPTSKRARVSALWALFAGLALLMVGNGLNGAVIGIRSGAEGFSVGVTGVIMAGYFAGFLVGPAAVVRMIPRVGHIRVFAGLASMASSAVLVHAIAVYPAAWTLMRLVFGFCAAGLYVVIESWLNEMSTTSNRGRTLAIYMIVTMASLGIGQLLIATADPTGFRLFIVASVLVSLSLVPVTLVATTKSPPYREQGKSSVRELLRNVPTGVLGSFVSGFSAGVLLGLGAVYASRAGFGTNFTAVFLAAPTLGAIAFQWPIGKLSDRIHRRTVIFMVALALLGVSSVLGLMAPGNDFAPLMMVALGGMLFPLYSLVVSYTLDWTPIENSVAASGTLVRINGCGAILGPIVTAQVMSHVDVSAFFWAIAGAQGVLVMYLGWRMAFKEAMPTDQQRRFVPYPARATDFAIRLALTPIKVPGVIKRSVRSRHHARPPEPN